jgi:hypothetical protein
MIACKMATKLEEEIEKSISSKSREGLVNVGGAPTSQKQKGCKNYVPLALAVHSSIACPYESCEVLAGRELRTACFKCSRSGIRRTFPVQRTFDLFCFLPYPAASFAPGSVCEIKSFVGTTMPIYVNVVSGTHGRSDFAIIDLRVKTATKIGPVSNFSL